MSAAAGDAKSKPAAATTAVKPIATATAAAAKDDGGDDGDEVVVKGSSIVNPPKATRRTGWVTAEVFYWHDTGRATGWHNQSYKPDAGTYNQPLIHFENSSTKRRIESIVRATGLSEVLVPVKPVVATRDQILWFHTAGYHDRIREMSERKGGDAGEAAPFGVGSYEIATLSIGGCFAAAERVLTGELANAYCLVRPPGHHAERNIGMGFCMFANVALTAQYCLRHPTAPVKRIAVIDWDVHHGNGTQQAFWDDDRVLFISMHQDGLYPDRPTAKKRAEWKAEVESVTLPADFVRESLRYGEPTEIGDGKGLGYTINVPLPPGTGEGGYDNVMSRVVMPALKRYNPEIVLVSCGFDAAAMDPTSAMLLSSDWYGKWTKAILEFTESKESAAKGRVVYCHEGGYSAATVPYYAHRVIEALSGTTMNVVDPYQTEIQTLPYQELQPHQTAVIDRVIKIHKPHLLSDASV